MAQCRVSWDTTGLNCRSVHAMNIGPIQSSATRKLRPRTLVTCVEKQISIHMLSQKLLLSHCS